MGSHLTLIPIEKSNMAMETYSIYTPVKNHNLPPSIQDFALEILLLINWYITPLPRREPPMSALIHNHHTLPSSILNKLIQTFQITQSYLSSPLTCPMQSSHYYSPYSLHIFLNICVLILEFWLNFKRKSWINHFTILRIIWQIQPYTCDIHIDIYNSNSDFNQIFYNEYLKTMLNPDVKQINWITSLNGPPYKILRTIRWSLLRYYKKTYMTTYWFIASFGIKKQEKLQTQFPMASGLLAFCHGYATICNGFILQNSIFI